jgi:hypothetical protein
MPCPSLMRDDDAALQHCFWPRVRSGSIELKKALMFCAWLVAPCGQADGFGVQPSMQVGRDSPSCDACGRHQGRRPPDMLC